MDLDIPHLPHPLPKSTSLSAHRSDPLAFLEDRHHPATQDYIRQEKNYCEQLSKSFAKTYDSLRKELKARIIEDETLTPHSFQGYEWFERWHKGKEYPIHYRRKDGQETVVLDENEWARKVPFFELQLFEIDPTGQKLAFGFDPKGDELFQIHFKDLQTNRLLKDSLLDTSGDGVWDLAGEYFYYVIGDESLREYRVLRHKIGTTSKDDTLIYEEEDVTFSISLYASQDHRYIFIYTSSKESSEVYAIPADQPQAEPRLIQKRSKGIEYNVDHHHGQFIIRSNKKAPQFQIWTRPASAKKDVESQCLIPIQGDRQITGFECLDQALVIFFREHGFEGLAIYRFSDGLYQDIEMPAKIGSISPSDQLDTDLPYYIFHYENPLQPEITFKLQLDDLSLSVLSTKPEPDDISLKDFVVENLYATASDQVKIPLTLIRHRNYAFDQNSPVYLYAYGAYGEIVETNFRKSWLSLLKRGFIIAIPHVRGGGYLGLNWYLDGKKHKKLNTFRDYISVVEYLCEQKYARPGHLYAHGESAGGLLLGVVLNQRGELFKRVVLEVPFLDALNTMLNPDLPLTTLEYEEWGDPNDKEIYELIKSYSPYENLTAGINHPELLVSTAMNDSRVPYWEPLKWVAKLRMIKSNPNPVILKIMEDVGHAGHTGRYQSLKETAYFLAFIIHP